MRYAGEVRYPEGGGLTAERRAFREGIRLQAGERFAAGEKTAVIAKELRVSVRSVERWRRAWREGGMEALRSAGPATPSTHLTTSTASSAARYAESSSVPA
ncbi:helix-turn-helix domain-containing protein [Streptomyces goshikiensis]|uniref:helix-turn-helix domain-containing protein n=1 Tax=Streptomyces goshikiensis TaxID=1942 RepID=UPI003655DE57